MIRSRQSGYTLVEMILYIVIFGFLFALLLGSVVMIIQSFNRLRTVRDLAESGSGALERIVREVRQARSVNDANSFLDQTPGRLQLNTVDVAGNDTTLTFAVTNGDLTVQEGTGATDNLLAGHLFVSSLFFRKWATTTASAIKIEMSLADDRLPDTPPVNFFSAAVLRGSY